MSSPCAMLITPMTPNVIARPIAASTSTEPRLRPKNSVSMRGIHARASESIDGDDFARRRAHALVGFGICAVLAGGHHGREAVVDIRAQRFLQRASRRRAAFRHRVLSRSASARPSRMACLHVRVAFLRRGARAAARRCPRRSNAAFRVTAASRTSASGSESAKLATALRSALRRLLLVVMREKSSGAPLPGGLERQRIGERESCLAAVA